MLTNFNEWFHDIIKQHQLNRYFNPIIISYHYKVIKPQPEVFYIALSNMKIQPHEAIFVDDKDKNIKSAQKLGINSILYSTYNKLAQDLSKLGMQPK